MVGPLMSPGFAGQRRKPCVALMLEAHLKRPAGLRQQSDRPLRIPEGAVVVPGSRRAASKFAEGEGLHLYTPVIVKYRDEKTDAAAALEDALR